MSLLCNSVEDLRVHVSELKQQADKDRAAVAKAHKEKVTRAHAHECSRGKCTFTVASFTVLRLWS